MSIRLEVENYRCLRKVVWEPDGVCALVGPNGSGKTTLLRVFDLLRDSYKYGFSEAIRRSGGTWGLRNFLANDKALTSIGLQTIHGKWMIELPISGGNLDKFVGERFSDSSFGLSRSAGEQSLREYWGSEMLKNDPMTIVGDEVALRWARNMLFRNPEKLSPFLNILEKLAVFHDPRIEMLRSHGSQVSSDDQLNSTGENIFSVLRNWRDKRDSRLAYQFVLDGLKIAFPEFAGDIEFELAGQTISARFVMKGFSSALPVYHAPNGFLIGLFHLTAVAGAPEGAIIAIDEMENSLHPFAIRSLVKSFRHRAQERKLTLVLATHSPVLLNEFKEEPSKVFIMQPSEETVPVALDQYRDPEWLAHFSLGDLYANLEFGEPAFSDSLARILEE